MSVANIIKEAVDNPKLDQEPEVIDQGVNTSDAAFTNMADPSLVDTEDEGQLYSSDRLSTLAAGMKQRKLQANIIEQRKAEAAAIEQRLLDDPNLPPEATFRTIADVRQEIYNGTDPLTMAVDELSAYNLGVAARRNDDDIAMEQYAQVQEKYSVQGMVDQIREDVLNDTDRTVPYLEATYEFFANALTAPKTGGSNVAGLLDEVFGTDTGFFRGIVSPGDQIVEAQKLFGNMSSQERVQALSKARQAIVSRSGIFFDSQEDAKQMLGVLDAVVGSRVQAEETRFQGAAIQPFEVFLSFLDVGGAGVLKHSLKTASKLSKARKAEDDFFVEGSDLDIDLGSPEDDFFVQGQGLDIDLGSDVRTKVDIDLDSPPVDIDLGPPLVRDEIDIDLGNPKFSPAQVLNEVSPKRAAPILGDALRDTSGKIAKGLGTTRSRLADDAVVPTITGGPIRKGVSFLMSTAGRSVDDIGADLAAHMHDSKMYTGTELLNVKQKLGKLLDNLKPEDATLVNKSEAYVDPKTGRVEMNYTVGAGNGNSFPTAQAAKDFLARLPAERMEAGPRILRYNASKDVYEDFSGPLDSRGEFLLNVSYRYSQASGATGKSVVKKNGILGNNVDSTVAFVKRMADSISRLDIRQAKVHDTFNALLKPLTDLKDNEAINDVWATLKEAEKLPEDYTNAELSRKLGGDLSKVGAYQAVRRFYQAAYEARNIMYRDYLTKQGFFSYRHGDDTSSWVKPIKSDKGISTVWWDEAGRIVDVQSLKAKGIELDYLKSFKPRRHTAEDGTISETPYIAVRKGSSNLEPLPVQVLHNKKTYLGRHLETRYVIEELVEVVSNGKSTKVGVVSAVANNAVDARKAVAEAGEGFIMRRANEITDNTTDYLARELDMMHDMQMLTNTKHRLDFNDLDITRQESLVSPMESLDNVRNTLAKNLVLNEWIELQTNQWMKRYQKYFSRPGFPWGGDLVLNEKYAKSPFGNQMKKEAELVRERIQLTSGVHPAQVGEKIQQRAVGTAEWLSRLSANTAKKSDAGLVRDMKITGLDYAAKGVEQVSKVNLVDATKTLGHTMFIIANPIRQLVMQSSGMGIYAGIEHGGKYFASGRMARDFIAISALKATKDLDSGAFDFVLNRWSELSSMSKKELRQMFDDFDNSGTLGSVSSHQFLEHGFRSPAGFRTHAGNYASDLPPSTLRGAAGTTARTAKGSVSALSKYGFEAGEKANRIMAYLAIRNKHRVNGNYVDVEDIATEALQVAGNMGNFNKAAFQEGAVGLPFQFMSHTTRMLQYMMPQTKWTSSVSSNVFSNQEKARVAMWNAALFGSAGMGLGNVFIESAQDEGIEVDSTVHDVLEEGLAGLALEGIIEGMTGTSGNFNMSEDFAPLSGLAGDVQVILGTGDRAATPLGVMYQVVADFATKAPIRFDDYAGAGLGAIRRTGAMMQNVDNIWMNPVLSTGEKLELQVRDIGSLLPVVNNALKSRIMANTGEYVTKYGSMTAQVTLADAVAKGVLGVNPAEVDDYYKLNAEMRGRKGTLTKPSHKELSTSANDLVLWTADALKQVSNGHITREEGMRRIESSRAAIFRVYDDPVDQDIFIKSFDKQLTKVLGGKNNKVDELVKLMASDDELQQEVGLPGLLRRIEQLSPTPYQKHVAEKIRDRMDKPFGE